MQPAISNEVNLKLGFKVATTSAIICSFASILIRLVSDDYQLPALIIAFWRNLFVVGCALPIFLIFNPKLLRLKKNNLLFLIAFGIVLAIFNILWTLAVTLTGASIATVLVYSSGGFTAVLGYFLLQEELGVKKIAAVILCLLGSLFVSGATDPLTWQTNTLGIVTGLLSGLLYACYSLLGRTAAQKGLNPWTTLFYSFFFAGVILLVINLLPGNSIPATAVRPADLFQLTNQWRGWFLLLLLAIGPTLIGFGLYNISLGLLPSSTANLIMTLEPVFTAISAFFFLHERLTALQLFGSFLIISAMLLLRVRFGQRIRNLDHHIQK